MESLSAAHTDFSKKIGSAEPTTRETEDTKRSDIQKVQFRPIPFQDPKWDPMEKKNTIVAEIDPKSEMKSWPNKQYDFFSKIGTKKMWIPCDFG